MVLLLVLAGMVLLWLFGRTVPSLRQPPTTAVPPPIGHPEVDDQGTPSSHSLSRHNAEIKFANVFAFVPPDRREIMITDCMSRKGFYDRRDAMVHLIEERERDSNL